MPPVKDSASRKDNKIKSFKATKFERKYKLKHKKKNKGKKSKGKSKSGDENGSNSSEDKVSSKEDSASFEIMINKSAKKNMNFVKDILEDDVGYFTANSLKEFIQRQKEKIKSRHEKYNKK